MRFLFLTVALIALAGCANKPTEFSCPQIGFIKGYDVKEYKDKNIRVEIDGIKGTCTAQPKEDEIALELTLPFSATSKAAKHDNEAIKTRYSVSLINEDEKLLVRKVFDANLEFDDTGKAQSEEGVDINLPIKDWRDGGYKYKIVIGIIE